MTEAQKHGQVVEFLWQIAELLRDAFKKSEHQNVILPFTVLRRLDYALAPTKEAVLRLNAKLKEKGLENRDQPLCKATGFAFYNTSSFTFDSLLDQNPKQLKVNLRQYIAGFSKNVQEIFQRFRFDDVIRDLDEVDRLYQVMQRFNEKSKMNLTPYDAETNPDGLTNHDMGGVFEHLIRRYNEDLNENPGEHYTPRDVVTLLVELTLSLDDGLTTPHIPKTVADCCSGTGGMISTAREVIHAINPTAKVDLFGQEINPRTWAVCRSDMLLTEPGKSDANNIVLGSTLSGDAFAGRGFDYQFANPPYGYEWKADSAAVEKEAGIAGGGRFKAGLPRISDGQMLFLQHMLAHMNPDGKSSYVGIVMNGSPLFTGDAGSNESNIRRWVLEHDYLYALVALPEQMFYNTGIQTYLWILTNAKPKKARGKVMLFDASGEGFCTPMRRSLGDKRREIADDQRAAILALFRKYGETENVKLFDSREFGYRQIQIERPLRLNFCTTPDRVERIKAQPAFGRLADSKKHKPDERKKEIEAGEALQEAILETVADLSPDLVKNKERFEVLLDVALEAAELKLPKAVHAAILNALSENDETADPVIFKRNTVNRSEVAAAVNERLGLYAIGKDGQRLRPEEIRSGKMPELVDIVEYESDSDLRDYESVPLKENIQDYFDCEVLPHVPDAWINRGYVDDKDGEVGRVGYVINFLRYFYKYTPPRDLAAIDADIHNLTTEIVMMLKEVAR
jgi:type I restriction enzyme M protein